MLDPELTSLFNRIFDAASEVEEVRLEAMDREALITIGLYPEERGHKQREPEWRRLLVHGIAAAAVWTQDEPLPPELRMIENPSPEFMSFIATLFGNQWLLDWDLMPGRGSLAGTAPTWRWTPEPDWEDREVIWLYRERPGGVRPWTLALWYDQIEVATPLETIQSVHDFIDGWRFMARSED